MNIRIKTEHGLTGLELPCREERIAEFCKGLDTTNNSKTEITVDYVYLNDRANALLSGKTYNLDKLNYLAKRLDSFDKNELTTFYAVAYSEKNNDIDRFINHTFNTHCYSVVRDFSDLDSIGKDMYLTQQGGVTMEELNRLDGEGYFKKVLGDNPNPIVTPYGILYRNKNEYEQVYDGSHFPQYEWEENMGTVTISKEGFYEFLYFPFADTELSKALERLGSTSSSQCEVEIDSEFLTDKILAAITEGDSIQNKLIQLSDFCVKYAEHGIREKPHLDTLVECFEPLTAKDLNAIMDSLHEFEIFKGIQSAEDYGRYMIIDSGHFEYDENLEEYIDFEKYGGHRLKWENGAFTDQGYILYHGYNMELAEMLSEIGIELALSLLICFGITPLFNQSISQKTEIVRVAKEIKAGDEITKDMVQTVEVGAYNLPENIIKTKETVIGAFATADFAVGDYILNTKVSQTPAYENAYLYNLDGTKQAISLTLKTFAGGLSGKLQSGDIVSVIAADFREQGLTVIPPELKYVEVISVTAPSGYDANTGEQTTGEDERELPSTVTLLVTPEQGNILAELEAEGKSHLSLVFRGDNEKAQQFIAIQEEVINKLHHPEISAESSVSQDENQPAPETNVQTGESEGK